MSFHGRRRKDYIINKYEVEGQNWKNRNFMNEKKSINLAIIDWLAQNKNIIDRIRIDNKIDVL